MFPPLPELDARIAALVADAPPLNPEQRHQLAVLLAPNPVNASTRSAA